MGNKRAVLYARVSTTHQNPELQEREIKAFIEAKGYQLITEYCDLGYSGSKTSRPELNKLMDHARNKEFDILIVWKLDRLARSLSHLISLITELKHLNIELISLRDNIDFTTPQGRLMFNIFGSLAEFERELIRERVIAGLANAKAKGIKLGRKRDRNDEAIISLRRQNFTIRSIAEKLGISTGKVQRALEFCNENLH